MKSPNYASNATNYQATYKQPSYRQVASADQVLHQTADHVARRSDAIGDVLLGQTLTHPTRFALAWVGQLREEANDAGIDVLEGQALDALGRLAHRADQL